MAETATERTVEQIEDQYRHQAGLKHAAVDIHAGAAVSFSTDDGAYVQGWIWVPRSRTNVTKEEHDSCV